MRRYLLVALWPAGVAAITAATVVALRRGQAPAGPSGPGSQAGLDGPGPAVHAGPDASGPDVSIPADPGLGTPAPAAASLDRPEGALPGWLPGLVKLGAISTAGGLLSYELMVLLGRPIVKHGPRIDVPIMEWTSSHQVEPWAAVLERLNKIANTWTTWGACAAAAACLATTWRTRKWLPPSVLGAAIVVDHYVTLALRRKFRRSGPPDSPLGTYPSGGCDRVVLFYGLIANLLWREFSGSQRGRVLALSVTSLLAFNAGYCREYLSRHWFTDVVTGLLYGGVLYAPFAVAVRVLAGPPARTPGRDGIAPAAALPVHCPRAVLPGWVSGGQRESAAAGVGQPVRARLAAEHGH